MADVYVIQKTLHVEATLPSDRNNITVVASLCAVSADGIGEDFPVQAEVPITFSATLGPSKIGIRNAISAWATSVGHTALRVVYSDLTMDIL